MFYEELAFTPLDDPRGLIPFHVQAFPLQDPLQSHASVPERTAVTKSYHSPNNLPKGRFLGTDWNQNNQPQFLGMAGQAFNAAFIITANK